MRYHLAALMLFTMLPVMNVLAAPVPDPLAILAIGPSPDLRETDEKYRKDQKEAQNDRCMLIDVLFYPEVKKLPSITRMTDPLPWLRENLRVAEEDGGRRLRFTFRAGSRAEQVSILNAFLRANIAGKEATIKRGEECIHMFEKNILELETRINSTGNPQEVASLQKAIQDLRTTRIPEIRSAIAHLKQTKVVKWAK